jgi:hypothetical protein
LIRLTGIGKLEIVRYAVRPGQPRNEKPTIPRDVIAKLKENIQNFQPIQLEPLVDRGLGDSMTFAILKNTYNEYEFSFWS